MAKTAKKKAARKTTRKKAKKKGAKKTVARQPDVVAHPPSPTTNKLSGAHTLLCGGIDSVNSLARLYDDATRARGRGAPTHEEQDLLRAMVVMAGAALDATTKRIIHDALADLMKPDSAALREAQTHVKRRLLTALDKRGGDRLAEALLDANPRQRIVRFIIDDLTGDSLQSVDQLERAIRFLGVSGFRVGSLREAFEARNQIIHEMDATPENPSRNRRQRRKTAMREFAATLLKAAAQLLQNVDEALQG